MKQKRPSFITFMRLGAITVALGVAGLTSFTIIDKSDTVSANAQSEYENQINSLQDQIAAGQNEVARLQNEANNLQNALAVLAGQRNTLQGEINLSQAKYEQLQQQIVATEAKIKKNQGVLSDTVGDLYVQSEVSPIEMIASSKNIGDFIDKQEYSSSVRDQLQSAIVQIKTLKKDLEKQEADVKVVIATQNDQKAQLVAKEVEQNALLERTRGEEAAYQSLVGSLLDQKIAAEAALTASLSRGTYRQAPAGSVGAGDIVGGVGNSGLSSGAHLHLEVRSGGGVVNPSSYTGNWQPPGYMSQGYGESPEFYGSRGHPGIDYAAGEGTAIGAIASGNMYRGCSDSLLGTRNNAYGYVAIVEHSGGLISIYAHMTGGPGECNYNTYYGGL